MRKIGLLFSTAVLLISVTARAEPITICGNEWLPFTKVDGPNIVGGISYEIHKEIFKRLAIEAEYKFLPWNRCLSAVESGTVAAITDANPRPNLVAGPSPISFYPVALWVRADMPKTSFTHDELAGVAVGAVQGYQLPDDLIAQAKWKLDLASDPETALKKLQAGRYDYYIGDTIETEGLVQKLGFAAKPLTPLLFRDQQYLLFGKKYEKLAADYYAEFAKLKQEGFIDRVYKARLGKTYDEMAQ